MFLAFEDYSPLAYEAVLIGNLLPTFQRRLVPLPSGQLNKSKILGELVALEWVKATVVPSQLEEVLRRGLNHV